MNVAVNGSKSLSIKCNVNISAQPDNEQTQKGATQSNGPYTTTTVTSNATYLTDNLKGGV